LTGYSDRQMAMATVSVKILRRSYLLPPLSGRHGARTVAIAAAPVATVSAGPAARRRGVRPGVVAGAARRRRGCGRASSRGAAGRLRGCGSASSRVRPGVHSPADSSDNAHPVRELRRERRAAGLLEPLHRARPLATSPTRQPLAELGIPAGHGWLTRSGMGLVRWRGFGHWPKARVLSEPPDSMSYQGCAPLACSCQAVRTGRN
jgi:hypothetical protein